MAGTIRVASFRIDYAATVEGSAQVTSAFAEVAYTADEPVRVESINVPIAMADHDEARVESVIVSILYWVDPPPRGINQLRGPTTPLDIQQDSVIKGPADN